MHRHMHVVLMVMLGSSVNGFYKTMHCPYGAVKFSLNGFYKTMHRHMHVVLMVM